MNKSEQSLLMVLALFAALIVFLLFWRKPQTSVGFHFTEPGFEGLSMIEKEKLNASLRRICSYESGRVLEFGLNVPMVNKCPTLYDGSNLVTDEVITVYP